PWCCGWCLRVVSLLSVSPLFSLFSFFFFNDTATTEIYTLSLHDALPIYRGVLVGAPELLQAVAVVLLQPRQRIVAGTALFVAGVDRKSTRLNSSHDQISYAVFCLKKKKSRACCERRRRRRSSCPSRIPPS